MWMPHEAGTGAFDEARRIVLDALERSEQQAREQAAEIVRQAEERARQMTAEAEQRAAEAEERLAGLRAQIDASRATLAAIRERLSGILADVSVERSPTSLPELLAPAARPASGTADVSGGWNGPVRDSGSASRHDSGALAAPEATAAEEGPAASDQADPPAEEAVSLLALRGGVRPWSR